MGRRTAPPLTCLLGGRDDLAKDNLADAQSGRGTLGRPPRPATRASRAKWRASPSAPYDRPAAVQPRTARNRRHHATAGNGRATDRNIASHERGHRDVGSDWIGLLPSLIGVGLSYSVSASVKIGPMMLFVVVGRGDAVDGDCAWTGDAVEANSS